MFAAVALFLLSLLGLIGAVNALRGPATDRHPGLRPPFLPALFTAEAVPVRVILHGALAALLVWAGALDHLAGRVGLVLTLLTWLSYLAIQWRAARTKHVMAAALGEIGVDAAGFGQVEWRRVLAAYPYRLPRDVERIDDIEYGNGLLLDLYRRRDLDEGPHPTLVYVHGGSWKGGNRRQQGRPLLHRLAKAGWVGFRPRTRWLRRRPSPISLLRSSRRCGGYGRRALLWALIPSSSLSVAVRPVGTWRR